MRLRGGLAHNDYATAALSSASCLPGRESAPNVECDAGSTRRGARPPPGVFLFYRIILDSSHVPVQDRGAIDGRSAPGGRKEIDSRAQDRRRPRGGFLSLAGP